MIKIKISYERPEELKELLNRAGIPEYVCKKARGQQGKYKRAYILIESIKQFVH